MNRSWRLPVLNLLCMSLVSGLLSLLSINVYANASANASNMDSYSIFGGSAPELISQLAAKGPDGFAAYTRWDIKTEFYWRERPSGCYLTYINVDLQLVYKLPKWEDKFRASARLQQRWDRWYANLLRHERQHAKHGSDAKRELEVQFAAIEKAANCRELRGQLDQITEAVLSEYEQKDLAYDRITKHGELEGAATNELLND